MPRGKPGERWTPTVEELQEILTDHHHWLASKGQQQRHGMRADLNSADLQSARLHGANLSEANLIEANLSGAKLPQCDLSGANLYRANLSDARLEYTTLSGAMLIMADLSKARLENANLSGAKLDYANLSTADLSKSDLTGTVLVGANLSDAGLADAKLNNSRLERATLTTAYLVRANLTNANLEHATLFEADLHEADLTAANLRWASLERANCRAVVGLRLNHTRTRDAEFTPVRSRWSVFLVTRVLPRVRSWLTPAAAWVKRRGWAGPAEFLDRRPVHNDRWSVLRQNYAGLRSLYLFFFVVLFALPYIGRAGLYSATSVAEQKVIDGWRQADDWLAAHQAAAGPAAGRLRGGFDAVEQRVRRNAQPRPLWQVLLKWDEGAILPSLLAVALVVYNLLLYRLIGAVGPLRDEEERSGRSPSALDYEYLYKYHQAVTLLFYLSFGSFVWNVGHLLFETVWVPAGG